MNTVYLGLFSIILDWILEKIFAPIFTFVGKLLGTVFSWLFENILAPVLQVLFETLMPIFIEMIAEVMAGVNYLLLTTVLRIIDYVQVGFDILIGIRPVTYTPPGGLPITNQSLLQVLIGHSDVGRVVAMITLLGLGFAFLLAIYSVLKSMFDMDFEGQRPVGAVLRSCFKTAVSFLMIPLFVMMMVTLSGEVLKAVNIAMGGEQQSLGSTVFLVSSLNAAKDESFNKNPSITDELRRGYALPPGSPGYKEYWDKDTVEKDFKLSKIDFLVGDSAAIFLVIVIGICLIVFVQRIFDIMMLYVVSPLFVAITPLDDGEKLGKWREMFVGKVFTGFGSAISMRLYLMLIPLVMSSAIDFTAGGQASSEMNYVIKLLFVMGGAWAVYKSSSLLTSLFSFQAAQSEMQMGSIVGGAITGATIGRATSALRSGMSGMFAGKGGKGAKGGGGEGKEGQDGKFAGKAGGPAGAGKAAAPKPGGLKLGGISMSRNKEGKLKFNDFKAGGLSMQRDAKGKLKMAGFQAGGFAMGRDAKGKMKINNMGAAGLKFARDDKGKMRFQSSKLLGMNAKVGADGKTKVSSFKVAGMNFDRDPKDGKMKLLSGNQMGISYSRHSDGKVHLTNIGQSMNFNYKQGQDGTTKLGGWNLGSMEYSTKDDRPVQQPTQTQQPDPTHRLHNDRQQQEQSYQQQPQTVPPSVPDPPPPSKSAEWHLGQKDDTPKPVLNPDLVIPFEPQRDAPPPPPPPSQTTQTPPKPPMENRDKK